MSNNYSVLNISLEKAEKIALDLYNIKGTASPLPGELDFNFKITTKESDSYILKISRPNQDENYLDFQQKLLLHIEQKNSPVISPKVIKDKENKSLNSIMDEQGQTRYVRLLSWISGRLWSSVNPQSDDLRFSLGKKSGLITKNLNDFEHPQAHRKLEWDNAQVEWVYDYLHLFEGKQKDLMEYFHTRIKERLPQLLKQRKSIVHNDLNDNNIIVSQDLKKPEVIAPIDYGDAIYTPIINDLGIAGMYLPNNQPDALSAILPFVKGYHQSFPLEEEELSCLYISVAIRLVISLTKAAINKQKEPENKYHQISAAPAWKVLEKWALLNEKLATYSFRAVCGYTAHPDEDEFKQWTTKHEFTLSDLFPSLQKNKVSLVDLGMESTIIGNKSDFEDFDLIEFRLSQLQKKAPNTILAGGYLEPRCIYTTDAFKHEGNNGYEYRTIHLGVDFWLAAQTPIHAFIDGEVFAVHHNDQNKDYGPTIILKHFYNKEKCFYTLYGHLSIDSLKQVNVGDSVQKGDLIAWVGPAPENGNWVPHLHFQIMLDMLENKVDFPGVAKPSDCSVWKSICPDPNLLLKLKNLNPITKASNEDLINYRKEHLGKGMSLQYNIPIRMVRGDGAYLLDQYGRKYLDTVNNVAQVGHEHPAVINAGQKQMAILNTNSRYLHENINLFTKELLATLPKELSVLHFVNSGSEANELALRMIKTASQQKDIIASEVGYHGNTNACIDISSYKFDGKGGSGAPKHTHIIPLPDAFRGKYQGKNTSSKYAYHIQNEIQKIQQAGRNIAGFIIEPIISCGGQIELPEGFLKEAYAFVRAAGGYCISDEVQVGCGRMGKTFWGFQLHDVIPDIITIGKPIGNGHPLAAVVCTQELASKFANGMEYFNTFGGNPVSCAIGKEVLSVIKREKLQENALVVGAYLKEELINLAKKYPIIGDVRGQGLFLGFELVDEQKTALPSKVSYLANRMKEHGILMSIDGPQHNVLKIKPPLVFNQEHADLLIRYLNKIFAENFMHS